MPILLEEITNIQGGCPTQDFTKHYFYFVFILFGK